MLRGRLHGACTRSPHRVLLFHPSLRKGDRFTARARNEASPTGPRQPNKLRRGLRHIYLCAHARDLESRDSVRRRARRAGRHMPRRVCSCVPQPDALKTEKKGVQDDLDGRKRDRMWEGCTTVTALSRQILVQFEGSLNRRVPRWHCQNRLPRFEAWPEIRTSDWLISTAHRMEFYAFQSQFALPRPRVSQS